MIKKELKKPNSKTRVIS